jgi:SAM-dependent methyltransferase
VQDNRVRAAGGACEGSCVAAAHGPSPRSAGAAAGVETAPTQGRLWGAAAYDWCRLVEPFLAPVYHAVFDVLGINAGTNLLDAGCGAGLALRLARARGATVSGIDASATLLRLARRRVPAADLRRGALERLPYPDGVFAVVTAFDSVPYAADPVTVLRELRRVAAPGAPVAVVTWAEPERCQSRRLLAAIGAMLPPCRCEAGGPFSLSRAATLLDRLRAAGLCPRHADVVPVAFSYPDVDSTVRAQLATAVARRAIDHAGEHVTAEVVRAALADLRRPDGSYRLDNALRYVVACA